MMKRACAGCPISGRLMPRKYPRSLLALVVASVLAAHAVSADALPAIGSRARIQAQGLEPGWHEGMFNRTRTEPPCYVVLVFKPRSSRTAAMQTSSIVPVEDITRLEVHAGVTQPLQDWAGLPSTDSSGERWQNVAPEVLREANKKCRRPPPARPAPAPARSGG